MTASPTMEDPCVTRRALRCLLRQAGVPAPLARALAVMLQASGEPPTDEYLLQVAIQAKLFAAGLIPPKADAHSHGYYAAKARNEYGLR